MNRIAASLTLLSILSCAPEVAERPSPRPIPAGDTAGSEGPAVKAASPAQCAVDADCVPATCCSAKACVPYDQQPECTGKLCNDACLAGVDDVYCNGRCTCVEGQCGVHYAPNPKVKLPNAGADPR